LINFVARGVRSSRGKGKGTLAESRVFWRGLGFGCGALGVLAVWVWVVGLGVLFGFLQCFLWFFLFCFFLSVFPGLVSFAYFLYA